MSSLSRTGCRLAVASNFDERLNSIMDGRAELRPTSLRIISSTVGYRKPSRWFFQRLIEATGASPHEILMVGDDATNDVTGALAAGLRAVRVLREDSAEPGTIASLDDLLKRMPT